LRRIALAGLAVGAAAAALVLIAGEVLSAPARVTIGAPPPSLGATTVQLPTADGETVAGWFSPGQPGRGAVLLLHGVRSNRLQMLDRAQWLHAAGYAVLLIDLPAHGESSGSRISFGYREAEGVRASLRYLHQQLPLEKVGVIGVSLGAASFMLSNFEPAPSAVVLESMYPTIEEAVADRLRIRAGTVGAWFAPVLLSQIPLRLGIQTDVLRPIDHMAALHAPVLIASGVIDEHTTVDETKRVFASAVEPKELWLVNGAAHVDLYRFDPNTYETLVFGFLAKHLRKAEEP
jgi:alpha-beta hydrolase superfamily lysophospholipase